MSTNLVRSENEVTMGVPSIEILGSSPHPPNSYRSNQLIDLKFIELASRPFEAPKFFSSPFRLIEASLCEFHARCASRP